MRSLLLSIILCCGVLNTYGQADELKQSNGYKILIDYYDVNINAVDADIKCLQNKIELNQVQIDSIYENMKPIPFICKKDIILSDISFKKKDTILIICQVLPGYKIVKSNSILLNEQFKYLIPINPNRNILLNTIYDHQKKIIYEKESDIPQIMKNINDLDSLKGIFEASKNKLLNNKPEKGYAKFSSLRVIVDKSKIIKNNCKPNVILDKMNSPYDVNIDDNYVWLEDTNELIYYRDIYVNGLYYSYAQNVKDKNYGIMMTSNIMSETEYEYIVNKRVKENAETTARKKKEYEEECRYTTNEVDPFDGKVRRTLKPDNFLVNADYTMLRRVGNNYYFYILSSGLGCASPYDNDKSYINFKFKDGTTMKLYHCGDIDCNETAEFMFDITSKMATLKSKEIVLFRLSGTKYYHDYESINHPDYFKVRLKCLN